MMTDNEIKKALEHCAGPVCLCSDCILFEPNDDECKCSKDLKLNALALINRLQAENKTLTSLCVSKDIIINSQEAEIEQ